jgi:hypothetical protein
MIGIGGNSFLIGVLVDVSGSMTSSIGSSGRQGINRLEAFSDALDNLVHKAAGSVHEVRNKDFPVKVRLFAYGFGFGGLLSFLGNSGPAVRDLLAPKPAKPEPKRII